MRGLARRVAEIREVPERVAVEWLNDSSLPEAESVVLRAAFLKEFSAHRVMVAAAPGVAGDVQVSIRETPTEFLLVARAKTASGEQVRMAELARTAFLPVMTRGNGLRLTKQLLWQQTETIVDASEFSETPGSGGGTMDLFLLGPHGVAIYRQADERLAELQELSFGAYRYASRAMDGAMQRTKDGGVTVSMPGIRCLLRGPAAAEAKWLMDCSVAEATGVATPAKTAGASQLPTGDAKGAAGEAVTLISSCDGNSWRLLGDAADWTQPDRVLLVNSEMKKDEAVASVEFAGPVRRLTGAEDGKSAVALVFDLSSGSYEIYRISMVCGR